jgi:hypothetical protein
VFASTPDCAREFRMYCFVRPQRKLRHNVKKNCRLVCECSRRILHSQVITATLEPPSRTPPRVCSLVNALRLINCTWPAPPNTILVRCEAASMHPHGQRCTFRSRSGRGGYAAGAGPNGTIRGNRVGPYGLHQLADAATSAPMHHIGTAAIGR